MAGTDLTGIDDTYRTPGNYLEVDFAQGPSSAGRGAREVVLCMPMTSAGTWTANTLYRVKRSEEAKNGGGVGSPIHRGIRKFIRHNKGAKVWALPYAATSGTSDVAATSVLTIATNASGTGTLSVSIVGELCQYTFASGDTPTEIGDGIEAAINAKEFLPVTASNSSGTVTITARIAGTSQGDGTTGVISTRAEITSGVGTTASMSGAALGLGSGTAGVEGTTTEAANFNTALSSIDSVRKYYIVTSLWDSTALGNLKTHITNKSVPKRGLRSQGIFAYHGTLANASTLFTGLNYERLRGQWQPSSEHDPAELAGAMAAVYQAEETGDPTHNFNGTSLSGIITTPNNTSDWPDDDDIEEAIKDGITPIQSTDSGAVLVHSVTTRSKTNSKNDSRVSRSSVVTGTDDFADTFLVRLALNFGQKKLLADELLADGTVNPNQRQIRNVVRPSMVKAVFTKLIDEKYADGQLAEPEALKASFNAEIPDATPSRLAMSHDYLTIPWLDQTTTLVSEVTTG